MLKKLSEEDIVLITRRYGKDLENPVSKKLSKEQTSRFYSYLVPKMRKLLKDPNAEIKTRKRGRVASKTTAKGLKTSEIENTTLEQVADETKPIVETTDAMITSEKTSIEIMSKEECVKILDLLRTPSFNQMLGTLSVKEAVIISLKLGYVDEKYFTTQSIAEFLGIEEQEVIDTTKKVLLLYKENINQFIDSAIQIATEEPKSSSYGKLLTK